MNGQAVGDNQAPVQGPGSELPQLRTDIGDIKVALGELEKRIPHQPQIQYHERVKKFQRTLTIFGIWLLAMLLAVLAYSYWSVSTSMSSDAFTLCILGIACLTVLLGIVIVVLWRLIERH